MKSTQTTVDATQQRFSGASCNDPLDATDWFESSYPNAH